MPDCGRAPVVRVLASGQGQLESVIADDRGRLYFTDLRGGRLLRLGSRAAEPEVLVDGITAPGGLTWMPDGSLLVGYGDSAATASRGHRKPAGGSAARRPEDRRLHRVRDWADDGQRRHARPRRRGLRIE